MELNLKRFFARASDAQIQKALERMEQKLQAAINWQAVIRTKEWSVVRSEFEVAIQEMGKVLRTNDLSDEKQRLEAIIAQRLIEHLTKLIKASTQGARVGDQEKVLEQFKQQQQILERQRQ